LRRIASVASLVEVAEPRVATGEFRVVDVAHAALYGVCVPMHVATTSCPFSTTTQANEVGDEGEGAGAGGATASADEVPPRGAVVTTATPPRRNPSKRTPPITIRRLMGRSSLAAFAAKTIGKR